MDDFRGAAMPLAHLLRLLDGFPYAVQNKGGTVTISATHIFITSDRPPIEWYTVSALVTLPALQL